MKKLLLSLLVLASSLVYNKANAQVYSQGNVVVDAFYGFPNLFSALVKSAINDPAFYSNTSVSSVGPLGLTAEYLVSDKIGLGAEFTYATTTAKYDYYDSYYSTTYNYKETYTRWRLLPRINIHFGSSDKVDPYLALGMGYGNFKAKVSTTDPNEVSADVSAPVNFSYRMGFGVRYFFTDHIGIMGEFGFGGPLARGGLAIKF